MVEQPQSMFIQDDCLGLVTDFYELTMAAGYWSLGHNPRATFEAFARVLPENRHYLLLAGLEQVIHYVQHLRFTGDQIAWLQSLPAFAGVGSGFWEFLAAFRFRGALWAMPEGTIFFADEPVIRATGSILECQVLETYLLTVLNAQTLVASKAARIVREARGRQVVEFGARRAHGPQMGLYAARAAYIGGAMGTSNVCAARLLNIPAVGTQAHSWVMSFPTEGAAFEAYAAVFPEHTICLIDTYDTLAGAHAAAALRSKLAGVRLDSGDLADLSRQVRRILDASGLASAKIVLSSDLNEYTIRDLLSRGAAVDYFGVGTDLVTSKDAPALAIVYKLVEVESERGVLHPVRKLSAEKATFGGAKQVFRRYDSAGTMSEDRVGSADEEPDGEPLLEQYLSNGELVRDLPNLAAIRARAESQLSRLPVHLHALRGRAHYPVNFSAELKARQ